MRNLQRKWESIVRQIERLRIVVYWYLLFKLLRCMSRCISAPTKEDLECARHHDEDFDAVFKDATFAA